MYTKVRNVHTEHGNLGGAAGNSMFPGFYILPVTWREN